MKSLALALPLLLAACSSGPSSSGPTQDQEFSVVTSLAVQDPSKLSVGQWVLYSVRREGALTPFSTKISVVAEQPDGALWVENRAPSDSGFTVWKSLVAKDGKLQELWVGPPGGRAICIYPGVDMHGRPVQPPKRVQPDPNVTVETAIESVAAAGRTWDCTRLTSTAAWAGGKTTTLVTWCHSDVPFSVVQGGKSHGGVVRRIYGKTILELVAHGTGAEAELKVR